MTGARFAALVPAVFAATLALGPAAWGQLPVKKFVTPDGKRPSGLFAPGVMVGKTLYIAGKGDYRPNEEFPAKVKNCLSEIEKTLKQAGLGMEHVVKSFVYLEDHDKYDELNKYYGEFFSDSAAGADDARRGPGAGRFAAGDHLHRLRRSRAEKADWPAAGRAAVQPGNPGGRHAVRFGQG